MESDKKSPGLTTTPDKKTIFRDKTTDRNCYESPCIIKSWQLTACGFTPDIS